MKGINYWLLVQSFLFGIAVALLVLANINKLPHEHKKIERCNSVGQSLESYDDFKIFCSNGVILEIND